ncbi:ABC transporter permease [Microbacterium capsulatum]|uniref:ABC transporter permease n=1 Tax=Microbacterium capsulatum TaxID=3041921 RepID=A0ABU0XEQ7_9MICO|nr:ABC transporter permease [Microbacterium sp. ASV81]MDQ4213583.1 ABC transporter permease [Microbacterium sp. ASV81]
MSKTLLTTIARRLGVALATILGAAIFSFILLRKLPGDPARLVGGDLADAATIAGIRQAMGLDKPLPEQFLTYLGNMFSGNLGFSYSNGQPVSELMAARLPASAELGITAVIIALGSAMLFASFAVYRRKRGTDIALRTASTLAMGTPSFWLALVALLILSVQLGIFPGPEGRLSPNLNPPPNWSGFYTIDALKAGEFDVFINAVWHLILPAAMIALGPFAFLSRLFRGQLRNSARESFVVVSRSRGLRRREVFLRHVIPNSVLPLVAATSLLFAELMTGSVLIEKVFAWPGVGSATVDAILAKDFAVVQGVILLSAALYVTVSFLADIAYALIDPRIRVGN